MIVSVATFNNETSDELEEGIRHINQEVVPAMTGTDGLRAAYWVVDRENGQRLSVTVWDSGEAAGAAWPGISAKITAAREAAGLGAQRSPDSSARYELVASL